MIPIKTDEIGKWRIEVENAEKFRDDNFGTNKYSEIKKAGENIDYFESGISGKLMQTLKYSDNEPNTTINIVYPIVKNVIPTLYWKNPYITAIPKKSSEEDSAPYAAQMLNYYFEQLNIKEVNKQIIFDAYVFGMGVCKIGYATQFGTDIDDEDLEKNREKAKKRGILETLGLRKPKVEEPKENIDLNEFITSENPYVIWVSPFDFFIDPAANSIYNARYCGQKTTKILKLVKENKNYSNTKSLIGSNITEGISKDIPTTEIDNFKTIDLYEIHYKTDKGIRVLVLAKDQGDYKALYHEDSIYQMDGFQYELLTFNKHNHKLYPKSDIDIVKGLQDRINTTYDNILDQIDKYVPKIFVDETAVTEQGKRALRDGDVGSIVFTNRDPSSIVKEANFTQLKSDLAIFIDKMMEVIMLETGLTKSQLMGMTNAQTATEAQIGQAGQNLRMSDKSDNVADFASKQARKLWQVIQQFVDLEEVELITGEKGIDDVTGMPKFDWMKPVDEVLAEKLRVGEYSFRIDVSSLEKPDLPVLRSQIERVAQLLAQEGVMQAFQMQGYKINLAEFGKAYLKLFPYVFLDIGKIIQPIGPNTTGLLPPQVPQGGGNMNSQNSPQPPNIADILAGQAGAEGGARGFGGA